MSLRFVPFRGDGIADPKVEAGLNFETTFLAGDLIGDIILESHVLRPVAGLFLVELTLIRSEKFEELPYPPYPLTCFFGDFAATDFITEVFFFD